MWTFFEGERRMEDIRGFGLSPIQQEQPSPQGFDPSPRGFDESHTEDTEMYQPVTQIVSFALSDWNWSKNFGVYDNHMYLSENILMKIIHVICEITLLHVCYRKKKLVQFYEPALFDKPFIFRQIPVVLEYYFSIWIWIFIFTSPSRVLVFSDMFSIILLSWYLWNTVWCSNIFGFPCQFNFQVFYQS